MQKLAKDTLAIYFLIVFIISSCGTRKPYYSFKHRKWEQSVKPDASKIARSIFLVGDTGAPKIDEEDAFLSLLSAHLKSKDSNHKNNAVIYLGDNIYESGMPTINNPLRDESEKKIERQLDIVKDFSGQIIFVPGNHDWNHSKKGGYKAILREQSYINNYLNRKNVMLPSDGCPGPKEILLGEDIVLLLVNSEWYLHDHYKPIYPDCIVESEEDFFNEFRNAVKRHGGKHILVALHHPLYSNGNHGGYFSPKDHFFPLTLIRPKLYIPLPILGSFYTLFRKYGISPQDIPNEKYQSLKEGLEKAVEGVKNVTFASGHDHNLQLKETEHANFIISGSGSKVNYAVRGKKASYVQSVQGLAKVNYYDNGEVWVEYYAVSKDPMGKLTFTSPLYALDPDKSPFVEKEKVDVNYSDSTKTVVAGSEYDRTGWYKFWLGNHYRKEWLTPVKVDYLDINKIGGGLTPVKKGGGQQTVSLRVIDNDSIQYNIRSVNKNPEGAVVKPLRNTFAQDLVKDQISSAHPYGAFTIAPMAKAIGIYHTNPRLVYVPYSPQLGEHIDTFGGMTALFEIRPDEDLSEYKRFGYSENIVSTSKMLEQLREDNDNSVDQEMFVKARLFDMVVGDWDRHEDQWRWAEFDKEDKGELYRPVPRDRDQVYTIYDGILPWIATRKWAVRNINNFDYDYKDVIGLMISGNALDRQLLSKLSLQDWTEQIKKVQAALTDEVIESAIRQMPEEVSLISGEEIISKLKWRRDNLKQAAIDYYFELAKKIDVLGTDKHELIEIYQESRELTKVTITKTGKDGDERKEIYTRVFNASETKELRIYTFDGNDKVKIEGANNSQIKLRIILGTGENHVENAITGSNVTVYENSSNNNTVDSRDKLRVKSSDQEYINEFDPEAFKFTYVGPLLSLQFNRDNGLFLGGGVTWRKYGFQKNPYKSSHKLMANYASSVGAYNIIYDSHYPDILGHNWDLKLSSHYYSPQFIFNYFGKGNGSTNTEGIDFYRLDMEGFNQEVLVEKNVGSIKLGGGVTYDFFNVASNDGIITEGSNSIENKDLRSNSFIGTKLYMNIESTDNSLYPRNGLRWISTANYMHGISSNNDKFVKLNSDFSVFLTPKLPIYLTLAMRFGGKAVLGDHPFYQSSFIGGFTNVRGYRMNRFAGNYAAYQNTELRLALSRLNNYLFNGYWGVYGFVDHGRVWADDSPLKSKTWHRGYGPGVWLNLFKVFITSTGVGFSDEGNFFYLRAGLFF